MSRVHTRGPVRAAIQRFACATSLLLTGSILPAQTVHFIHGQWFDGQAFTLADFYSIGGILSHTAPAVLGQTIDLHNAFVIPPFGDAHEHNFDDLANTPAVTQRYLKDGIFYAQGMTDVLSGANAVAAVGLGDTPDTVDVTYAHGGLTGLDGHPKEVYESLALGFYYPASDAEKQQVRNSHLPRPPCQPPHRLVRHNPYRRQMEKGPSPHSRSVPGKAPCAMIVLALQRFPSHFCL